MYVVSKYIKYEKLSLLDIFYHRNADSYNTKTVSNRVYEYKNLPPSLVGKHSEVENYYELLRMWWEQNKKMAHYINSGEYDYEMQVAIQSKIKRENKGIDDEVLADKVKEELASKGKKFFPLYHTFFIPKKKKDSNGRIKWRRIDAPNKELKASLTSLSNLFDSFMEGRSNHQAAFAYVKGKSIKDAEFKHAKHKSRWYLKMDLTDFFGSTTPEFVYRMFSQIYPFCEMIKIDGGVLLKNCLSLCFLDGKLPQGTPISPIITNIMMIPIDHKIQNSLFNEYNAIDPQGNRRSFVYTRYADDIIISSRVDFKPRWKYGVKHSPVVGKDGKAIDLEVWLNKVFAEFKAPFKINKSKTKYTSVNGSNWSLGLLINQDFEVSLGHKNRDVFSAMIWNYAMQIKEGKRLPLLAAQQMLGRINYHYCIEGERTEKIIIKTSEKSGVDVMHELFKDVKKK